MITVEVIYARLTDSDRVVLGTVTFAALPVVGDQVSVVRQVKPNSKSAHPRMSHPTWYYVVRIYHQGKLNSDEPADISLLVTDYPSDWRGHYGGWTL